MEENLHIRFSENTPNAVSSLPDWLFDIDALTRTMNYEPITADLPFSQYPKSSQDDGFQPSSDSGKKVDEYPSKGSKCKDQEKQDNVNITNNVNTVSLTVNATSTDELPFDLDMPALEDVDTFNFSNEDEDDGEIADMNNLETTIQVSTTPTTRIHKDHPLDQVIGDLHSNTQTRHMSKNLEEHRAIGTKWVFQNKKDERGIVIRNKARLVVQRHTQEKGIDYDEVFAPVARYKAIRLFLAYACFKDFVVYQMDVKSAFLYGKIEEEVYVCQQTGFEDLDFLDKMYKVEKALYRLHQALRAWYETLSTYLLENGFHRGKNRQDLIHQKAQRFTKVKNASTPMETQKPLLMDEDGEEVDLHMYRSMIGSLMYLTSSRPDIMFVVFKLLLRQEPSTGKRKYMPRKAKRKDTQVPQLSGPIESVADEAVYMELDDRLVRLATTASSLEVKRNSGNINKIQSKATPNESSSQGTDSDGGPRCQDTKGDTITQTRSERVSKLSNDSLLARGNTLQSDEDARVESYDDNEDLGKDASKQERKIYDIDDDEDITPVNDHNDEQMFVANQDLGGEEVFVAKQDENVIEKEVDAAQEKGKVIMIEEPMKLKKKDQIMLDEEVGLKLQAELQAKFDKEQRLTKEQQELNDAEKATLFMQLLEKRGKFFAAKREERRGTDHQQELNKELREKKEEEQTTNKSSTKKYHVTELVEESSKKAKAELIEESLRRAGTKQEQESSKKQKIDDDKETTELKQLVKIIPNEEELTIDAIPLAVKPPSIVDWKIHKERKKSYYKIIRADGSSKIYLVFSHMLKSFDKEDVETLWKLVKAKHGSTRPEEDYEECYGVI
nr:hypothetical protein [Tanacetum cinerariifolium]